MKARLSTKLVNFELEAQSQKEMFKLIAETQEVFAEATCGLCGKGQLRFVVRTVEGNDYHELHCQSCGARLAFGQSKQKPGQLFPIRKLDQEGRPARKEGSYGKHRGWSHYRGEVAQEEAAPRRQ